MPISSGANTWPTQYFHKQPPPPPIPKTNLPANWWNLKTQVRPKSRSAVPNNGVVIIDNQPPPPPIQQHIYHQGPPMEPYPPPPQVVRQPTMILNRQPSVVRQPSMIVHQPAPPYYPDQYPRYPPRSQYPGYGYGGYGGGYGGGGYGNGFYGGGCDPDCCSDSYFTNEMYGANAGCCQGGMFGSRNTYPRDTPGNLRGTGQRRCCAFIFGTLLGLLLLGLLIGLLAGLLPANQLKTTQANIVSTYPNGFYSNGIYYYPITNPPDIFYFAMGFNIPCNAYNNNSMIGAVTNSYVTVGGDPNTTAIVTYAQPVTNPNCNSLTTSYVKAVGISVSTTTQSPWPTTTAAATKSCFATYFVLVFAIIQLQCAINDSF